MPRGDKTGPLGNGAMTGRRMGFCTGNNNPGFMNSRGRRFAQNRFGNRNMYFTDDPNQTGASQSQSEINDVKKDINELKTSIGLIMEKLNQITDKD